MFVSVSFRFVFVSVSFGFVWFRLVWFRFVWFRLVSFRFVSFRFVSFRFNFVFVFVFESFSFRFVFCTVLFFFLPRVTRAMLCSRCNIVYLSSRFVCVLFLDLNFTTIQSIGRKISSSRSLGGSRKEASPAAATMAPLLEGGGNVIGATGGGGGGGSGVGGSGGGGGGGGGGGTAAVAHRAALTLEEQWETLSEMAQCTARLSPEDATRVQVKLRDQNVAEEGKGRGVRALGGEGRGGGGRGAVRSVLGIVVRAVRSLELPVLGWYVSCRFQVLFGAPPLKSDLYACYLNVVCFFPLFSTQGNIGSSMVCWACQGVLVVPGCTGMTAIARVYW